MSSYIPGTKFQKIVDTTTEDAIEIFRFEKYINSDTMAMANENGVSFKIPVKDIPQKYVQIAPDAFLNIMITDEGQDAEDVYVCVNKSTSLISDSNMPVLVLRQNFYDEFTNALYGLGSAIIMGGCVTSLQHENIGDYMEFKEIGDTYSVAIYFDDDFSKIDNYLSSSISKKIVTTLGNIKTRYEKYAKGFATNLQELVENNDFATAFYSCFNITAIDWPIDLYDGKKEDIILNGKQIDALQNMLKQYIIEPIVIKYDKDLDISKIVSKQHIMVRDSNKKIYLIAYTSAGYMVDETNQDIIANMKPKK